MTHEGWKRIFIGLGGLNGAIAVSMGAYATHVLAGTQQDFGLKGSNYQLYHAAALLAVAALQRPGGRFAVAAGLLLSLGMLLFCGGLYGVAVCGATGAPTAPIGGSVLILGWFALLLSAVFDRSCQS